MVALLLARDPKLFDVMDNNHSTTLKLAVDKSQPLKVCALAALGPADCALSAFHLALRYSDEEVAEALLQQSPKLNFEVGESGNTALHYAVTGSFSLSLSPSPSLSRERGRRYVALRVEKKHTNREREEKEGRERET